MDRMRQGKKSRRKETKHTEQQREDKNEEEMNSGNRLRKDGCRETCGARIKKKVESL